MEALQYFETDHQAIADELRSLISEYPKLESEEVFSRTVRIFDDLRTHFEKQEVLLSDMRNIEGMQSVVSECLKDRQKLLDEIGDVVNLHVDEPGGDFRKAVIGVLKRLQRHIEFSENRLYPAIRKYVYPAWDSRLAGQIHPWR